VSAPVDLLSLWPPEDWTDDQIEAEARRIYFDDLVPNPPVIPAVAWLQPTTITVANSEGGFQKIFGESAGWAGYSHHKTGRLSVARMQCAAWIRPVLELRVPKTKVYVNHHSLKPREFVPGQKPKKNRIFVTTGKNLLYFISLVYVDETTLALATAYEPDGEWLRKTLKKDGTSLLGPPPQSSPPPLPSPPPPP
jgi:hypothetical protein